MSMACFFAAVDPDTLDRLRAETELERALAIHKFWHGIHDLLNGTAEGGDGPCSLIIWAAKRSAAKSFTARRRSFAHAGICGYAVEAVFGEALALRPGVRASRLLIIKRVHH